MLTFIEQFGVPRPRTVVKSTSGQVIRPLPSSYYTKGAKPYNPDDLEDDAKNAAAVRSKYAVKPKKAKTIGYEPS